MARERPELGAEPAVAGLHFVGDVEAAGCVRSLDEQPQLRRRRRKDAVAHQRPVEKGRGEVGVECVEGAA